jgi:hypothetical protein
MPEKQAGQDYFGKGFDALTAIRQLHSRKALCLFLTTNAEIGSERLTFPSTEIGKAEPEPTDVAVML